MKKMSLTSTAALMASGAALLASGPVQAEDFGIGINIGNLGFGVEARQPLSPSFDLRFGVAGLVYKLNFTYDDIDYKIEQSQTVPEIKLDWRPMQGMFRLTFGAAYYNQVSQLKLYPDPTTNYSIGNGTYTGAAIGSMTGKLSYHVGAPYFGVGWDFLPKEKRFGFTVDVGAYYRNEPDVWLYSPGVTANDLALEADKIQSKSWTYVPTVKLGMLFRF